MDDEEYNEWLNTYQDHGLSFEDWRSDVKQEYIDNATPGEGTITYDEGYAISKHSAEIETAQWIHDNLGGDITLLAEANQVNTKMPDYLWNGRYWELKNISTEKASDNAVRSALKQIVKNPGGIILNCGTNNIDIGSMLQIVRRRIVRGDDINIDIMVLSGGELSHVIRYKK